jgi:hypothetical protein
VSQLTLLEITRSAHETTTLHDLNNGGASDDGVISGSGVAAGENNVALSSNTLLGDHDLESTVDLHGVNEDRAGNSDESSVDLAVNLVSRGLESDLAASLDHHASVGCGGSKGRESLDGQRSVGLWAGLDELRSECVDLVVAQRVVEGSGEGRLADGVAYVGRVAGLDSQDGSSGSQVGLGHDVCGGTEVGADTNTLEDAGSGKEGGNVLVSEVVGAGLDGFGSSSAERTSQELNVSLLIARDGHDAVVGLLGEIGGLEVLNAVLGEGLGVEGVLEVLESKGVVENLAVGWAISTLDGSSSRDSRKGSDGEDGGLHFDGWILKSSNRVMSTRECVVEMLRVVVEML